MSAPVSKKEKQGERKERKRVRNAHLQRICYVAPFDGDHTGSRATEWLTEINQRRHTCMIDASIYGSQARD